MGTSRVCLCCAQIEAQTSKRKLAGCVAGTKTLQQDDQPSARFASGAQRTSWLAPNTPPRSPSAAMDTKAASSASSCRRPASALERSPVAGSEELALLPAAAHANAVVTLALQADGAMGRKPHRHSGVQAAPTNPRRSDILQGTGCWPRHVSCWVFFPKLAGDSTDP